MDECPTCGRTIRGDVCPYCDEEVLDDDAAESTQVPDENLVEAFTCKHEWQAEFIISLLESEGIPAYQKPGSSLDAADYSSGDAGGSISIQVEEEDVDRAREIIEAAESDLESQEH